MSVRLPWGIVDLHVAYVTAAYITSTVELSDWPPKCGVSLRAP